MKNKIISIILSVIMICSVCTAAVSADTTEIMSENFDGTVDTKWTEQTSGGWINFKTEEGFLKANSASAKSSRTAALSVNTENRSYMSMSFDFKAANHNSNYGEKHGLAFKDSEGNEVFNLLFPNHRNAKGETTLNSVSLAGVTLPVKADSEWYTLNTVMDFEAHRMAYSVTLQNSDEVICSLPAMPMSSQAAGIRDIEFYINRGYDTDYVAIDNFVLNEIDNPNLPEPPVVANTTIEYKCGDEVVKSETIELSNVYEGDKYTYTSNNYVQGTDGAYYYVACDYTEDKENEILNNTSVAVNSALKQTVESISADSVITYNVQKAEGVVFYDEFENILKTSAQTAPNGRYTVSGGMFSPAQTGSFYEVTEDGYYQVVICGCPLGGGTGVFANTAEAETAETHTDGLFNMGYGNNTYYGIYSCKTLYLKNGDNLTVRTFGNMLLDYAVVRKVTPRGEIVGSDGISVVSGGTSADYSYSGNINETPVWSVNGVDGVTVDNGTVTVSENAQEGTATLTAAFDGFSVNKEIAIAKPVVTDFDIIGTTTLNIGDKKQYVVSEVKDQFGNDITSNIESVFTSYNDAITITPSGEAEEVRKGNASISAAVTAGESEKIKSIAVKSDLFYIIANAAGAETTVDITSLAKSNNIKGYRISTADANRKLLSSYTVDSVNNSTSMCLTTNEDATVIYVKYSNSGALESIMTKNVKEGEAIQEKDGYRLLVWKSLQSMQPANTERKEINLSSLTVDTDGAAKVEVSPIYEYSFAANEGEDVTVPDCFADGEYDFTITKSTLRKLDLYVNGYMIGNNIDEAGVGRTMTDADKIYSVKDILVDKGTITISKEDCTTPSEAGIDSAVISKTPSIVERKQKLYIIGDSLVADYYGELQGTVGTGRSGWGQVMQNFVSNDVEVVNMANAGQYASGLLVTAFPGIMHTVHEGDYLIIESGWNDLKYSNYDEMYESVLEMVDECEQRGIRPVLVTPNASNSTWSDKNDVRLSSAMRAAADTAQNKYVDVIFVDLAQISYDYLHDRYGDDIAVIDANFSLGTAGGDKLHLSYLAAMKWAEVVAQGMADTGVDFINKNFAWSVNDTQGNEITVQVK